VKFGIMFASVGAFATAEGATAIATAADEMGLESIWPVEHVIIPDGYQSRYPYHDSGRIPMGETADLPDPLLWLAYVAGQTRRIRLATGILIVPQRNPLILAKECATLDRLSNGRFELGIGVGWLAEEFEALGVPFEDRGGRTDDYCAAMAALWSQEKASYHGKYVDFDGAISQPRPINGSVPIIIGGHSPAAARRAGRDGRGLFPAAAKDGDFPRLFEIMRAEARSHGRDPDAIEVTTGNWSVRRDTLDRVKELEDLGIHRLIVAPPTSNVDRMREAMEQLAEKIAPVATR
jgi:probable F420-dependent oxidoreductase